MRIDLGSSWGKKLQRRVNGVHFEVGILDDKPHKKAVDAGLKIGVGKTTYAGGPVRKTSRVSSGLTIGEVLKNNMERTGKNFLLEPFRKKNSEILKFTTYFLKYIVGRPANQNIRRIENLLQAIVRNPIFKLEYGDNTTVTADIKGFDRHLFDTGQMFRAIRARVIQRKK